MKKIRFKHNVNTEIKFKIKHIIQICLSALEAFLNNISKTHSELLDVVVKNFTSQFEKIEDYNLSLNSESNRFQAYPQLVAKSINMILNLVQFTKYQYKSVDEEIYIEVSDLIHTFNYFEYSFIESLIRILPFKEVIKLYQDFVNKLTQSKRDPKNYFENLQDLSHNFARFSERWHDPEATLEIIDEEKLVYKIKKCRWAEDLKDLNPEIGYTIMCHQDFERAKNFNPNFVLTRNHTLMRGDAYCDFCYHDTRIKEDISHPADDFWNKFN